MKTNNPSVSIVVPTLGRKNEVYALLKSIIQSTVQPIEVIILDQNCSNILDDIIFDFKEQINIKHVRVNFRGLSKARNYAIKYTTGEILMFPDDDCRIFSNTIGTALTVMNDTGTDVIFGKCIDEQGKDSIIKFSEKPSWLNLRNFEGKFIEATMFIKRQLLDNYSYDEGLGAGTFHGAEEGYDLVYRMLKNYIKMYYSPNVVFYHPQAFIDYNSPGAIHRVFSYRCGFGRVCMKHKLYWKLAKRFFKISMALPFFFLLDRRKLRYYLSECLGIVTGIVVKS
ncbi:MAG: glycosyltransferase [Cytophagaceae bacterium]|nr:glycosyltransferase [Cytophagaceae bacterium]